MTAPSVHTFDDGLMRGVTRSLAQSAPRKRIYWWHPRIMDYRVELFDAMASRYDMEFLFMERSPIPVPAPAKYATGRIALAPTAVPMSDLVQLWQGIGRADVFVSSFLANAYTVWGLLLARARGVPTVIWEELQWLHPGARSRIKYRILSVLARLVDAFFVMGEVQATALARLGVSRSRIFIANEYPGLIYSAVPCGEIALPFDDASPMVLYMGRMIEVKGVEYLLQAWQQVKRLVPRAQLVLAGDGALLPAMKLRAEQLGLLDFHFLGYVSEPEKKSALYRRASVLVVPSIRAGAYAEGGPLVVLEALSAGLPVVGTDALGSSTAWIKERVNGEIVPEKNGQALADAIVRILRDRQPTRADVLKEFARMPDVGYQVQQLEAAIAHACSA